MSNGSQFSPPEHLAPDHDCAGFDCGIPELNEWLKLKAVKNEASGASRTYVICADDRVIGYYALSTSAVTRPVASGKVRRQMPEPIPVMLIGRLAVVAQYQGLGLGYGLLRDARLRTLQVAEQTGVRTVLLHAMTPDAKRFYQRAGFHESPVAPMTMMITIGEIEKSLQKQPLIRSRQATGVPCIR